MVYHARSVNCRFFSLQLYTMRVLPITDCSWNELGTEADFFSVSFCIYQLYMFEIFLIQFSKTEKNHHKKITNTQNDTRRTLSPLANGPMVNFLFLIFKKTKSPTEHLHASVSDCSQILKSVSFFFCLRLFLTLNLFNNIIAWNVCTLHHFGILACVVYDTVICLEFNVNRAWIPFDFT